MCLRTLKNSGRAVQTDPTLLRFGDHGTKKCWELLAQKFDRFQTFATTCNRVCKRTQHVTSDNVGSCWPTMLRPFARGFTRLRSCVFVLIISSLSTDVFFFSTFRRSLKSKQGVCEQAKNFCVVQSNVVFNHYVCHLIPLTSIGAQPNVKLKPEAQRPEFLRDFSSLLRICFISFIKDSSHA